MSAPRQNSLVAEQGERGHDFSGARRVAQIRRPFIAIAFFFLIGTFLGIRFVFPFAPLAVLSFACLLPPVLRPKSAVSNLLLYAAVVLLAASNAGTEVRNPSPSRISRLLPPSGEHATLAGVVRNDPLVQKDRGYRSRCTLLFEVEALRRTQEWEQAEGMARVEWSGTPEDRCPSYGERWIISGPASRIPSDRASWLDGDGNFRIRADGSFSTFLSGDHGNWFVEMCLESRRKAAAILKHGMKAFPTHTALVQALLLGCREELPSEVYETFSRTGTLHIIAISGVHVGIVAMLLIGALKVLGVSRTRWVLALAPALAAYCIGTGMSTSAIRACIMAVLFWLAPLLGRKPDGPSALAIALVLILAFSPLQLIEPSFLFSFTAMAGLLVFYPGWSRRVTALTAPDPLRLQPENRAVRTLRIAAAKTGSLIAASLATWLVTAPLTALYFNTFSPIALLGNLVVIPGAFMVLLTGVLSLAIGSVSLIAAEVFNHANVVFTAILVKWVDLISHTPGGFLVVPAPSAWFVGTWYGFLCGLTLAEGRARRIIGVTGVAAMVLLFGAQILDKSAYLDVIDVGHGNAVLVDVPGSGDVLVDAGSRFRGRAVVRHLRKRGVGRLSALVLTHGDKNHVSGALEVLRSVPVEEVWCSPFVRQSPACIEVLHEAARRGCRIRRLTRGSRGSLAGGVVWEVLHPPDDRPIRRGDDASVVMRVARGARSVLLMADAGANVEAEILDQPVDLVADVLLLGQHGSGEATSEEWLAAVSPALAVISVGNHNAQGCPSRDVLQRLEARGIPVWRTDQQGTARLPLRQDCLLPAQLVEQRPELGVVPQKIEFLP